MKAKMVSACALLAAATAWAANTEVQSDNTFGILKVASSETLLVVGIPWADVGAEGGEVYVTNLVSTANGIAENDVLFWYDASVSGYKGWVATKVDGAGTLYWKPADGTVDSTSYAALEGKTLARGNALILKRTTTSAPIYLCGQVTEGSAGTTTIAAAAPGKIKVTLFSSPYAESISLSDGTKVTFATPTAGDSIMLSDGTTYVYYTTDGWGKEVDGSGSVETKDPYTGATMPAPKTISHEGITLPAGQGAWYFNTGTSAVTITWGASGS